MLIDYLLRDGAAWSGLRTPFVVALREPWCWPVDDKLIAAAQAGGGESGRETPVGPPGAPAPGETCLISVVEGKRRTTLWRLVPHGWHADDALVTPFANDAAEALRTSVARSLRDLAALVPRPVRGSPEAWGAIPIFVDAEADDATEPVLFGASFGLSFGLASAALVLDMPLPSTLAATAEVRSNGELAGVGGLEQKVAMIAHTALGVTQLLVAAEDAEVAREIVSRSKRKTLLIVGCATLADALTEAFPELTRMLRARWRTNPAAAKVAANALFDAAVDSRVESFGWPAIRSASRGVREVLEEALPNDRDAHLYARWAEQIAARHAGKPDPANHGDTPQPESHSLLIDWPDAATMSLFRSKSRQARFLAHVVQSAADEDDAHALEYAQAVEREGGRWLPPLEECCTDHLKLLGATARCWAAAGDYRRGADAARKAVEGWLDYLQDPTQASYALCELVRLVGLSGSLAELTELCDDQVAVVERADGLSSLSRAYVRVAVARARVVLGDAQGALDALDERALRWPELRDDVQKLRVRWLAQALVGVGRPDAANEERAAARARWNGDSLGLWMSLDAALESERAEDIEEAVANLARDSDAARLLARWKGEAELPPRALGRRLANECRY